MTPSKCPSCQAEFTVDLSKIPAGKAARVACPACKNAFTVNGAAPGPGAESPGLATAAGRDEAWLRRELEALRSEVEKDVTEKVLARVFGALGRPVARVTGDDDDVRPALVCESDPATANMMAEALRDLGYAPHPAPDLKTAWRALDADFRVVIVTDSLQDDPEAATKILDRLSRLHGGKRRRLFAAYVGQEVRTGDGGVSFVLGANMTIARADMLRFKDVMRRGMAEHEKMYRPFLAALEAAAEEHGAKS